MLLNCGVSVPWTARRSSQSILKEISPEYSLEGLVLNIHWKDWSWSWNSNTLATWWEELTHLKRPWCWERLKAGGEGDNRGWYGWMASLTQGTWVWANSRSWQWTGRSGMLQSMGLQRVRHNSATELNVMEFIYSFIDKHVNRIIQSTNPVFLWQYWFNTLHNLCSS